ncbi:MAG: hypothetical protein Q4E28_03245 [Clostridia bacterium]|nr:hypothetical protein [Clostridia bacterium]
MNNTSNAYALPRINPVPERNPKRLNPRVIKKSSKNIRLERQAANIKAIKVVFISALLFTMIGLLLFSRVKIDEIGRQEQKLKRQTEVLAGENVRLNTKLETAMSLEKVEDIAKNKLGMVKVQDTQIEYVKMDREDKVTVTEKEDSTNFSKLRIKKKNETNFGTKN